MVDLVCARSLLGMHVRVYVCVCVHLRSGGVWDVADTTRSSSGVQVRHPGSIASSRHEIAY